MFGGGGLTAFRDATQIFCGTASPCGGNSGIAYTAGGDAVAQERWIGVEGSYLQPRKPTATGSGTNYSFDSELDARLATVAGVVGIPIGPVQTVRKGREQLSLREGDDEEHDRRRPADPRGADARMGLDVWRRPRSLMAPAVGLYANAGFVRLKGALRWRRRSPPRRSDALSHLWPAGPYRPLADYGPPLLWQESFTSTSSTSNTSVAFGGDRPVADHTVPGDGGTTSRRSPADFHAGQALVPALNHVAVAECE